MLRSGTEHNEASPKHGTHRPCSCSGAVKALIDFVSPSSDDDVTRTRKTIMLAYSIFAAIFTVAVTSLSRKLVPDLGLLQVNKAVLFATNFSALLWLLVARRCSEAGFVIFVGMNLSLTFVRDLEASSTLALREGLGYVLTLNMLALGRVSSMVGWGMVAVMIVFKLMIAAEMALRFGMFDVWGSASYTDRRELCECDRPPCATKSVWPVMGTGVTAGMMLVATYAVVRHQVNIADQRTAEMRAAVKGTREVARALADFDLVGAEALLRAQHSLPEDLSHAMHTILKNMRSYRPFLPEAIFLARQTLKRKGDRTDFDDVVGPTPPHAPLDPLSPSPLVAEPSPLACVPGMGNNAAALAAVSVWRASVLWQRSNSAMQHALTMYNSCVREAVAAQDGYLVRSTGDAYVVAFDAAMTAVTFGGDLQVRLEGKDWPQALAEADHEVRSFTVSIGVHYGVVYIEKNVFTQQYDYFGNTLDVASRVGSFAAPGAVTVSSVAMQECGGAVGSFTLVPRSLKVAMSDDVITLMILLPQELIQNWQTVLDYVEKSSRSLGSESMAATEETEESSASTQCLLDDGELDVIMEEDVLQGSVSIGSAALLQPLYAPGKHGASTGVVKLGSWNRTGIASGEAMARELSGLHKVLKETGGVLTTVVSRTIVVSWNAQSACPQYLARSVQFTLKLSTALKPGTENISKSPLFNAGLASGSVPAAILAPAADHSLLTVVGPCVDLSFMLCAAAAEVETAVLVASAGVNTFSADPFLQPYLRPLDIWSFDYERREGNRDSTFMVLQLDMELATAADTGGQRSKAWNNEFTTAFVLKDTARLLDLAPDDPVVERACRLIDSGTHLPHALMCTRTGSVEVADCDLDDSEAVPFDEAACRPDSVSREEVDWGHPHAAPEL